MKNLKIITALCATLLFAVPQQSTCSDNNTGFFNTLTTQLKNALPIQTPAAMYAMLVGAGATTAWYLYKLWKKPQNPFVVITPKNLQKEVLEEKRPVVIAVVNTKSRCDCFSYPKGLEKIAVQLPNLKFVIMEYFENTEFISNNFNDLTSLIVYHNGKLIEKAPYFTDYDSLNSYLQNISNGFK